MIGLDRGGSDEGDGRQAGSLTTALHGSFFGLRSHDPLVSSRAIS